jgi:DMSO reductase anchor subunit
MHPSPSVIIFTSLSGLGFGLLVFLGLQMPDVMGFFSFIFFTIGFGLAVGGLLASTFHLGRPERSLKAFKQWRSSWLSREAISAVFTLSVMAVYAIGRIFFDYDIRVLGIVGSIMSLSNCIHYFNDLCTTKIDTEVEYKPNASIFLIVIFSWRCPFGWPS